MTQVAIQIPDDLEPFIEKSVKTGLFSDVGDFVVNLLYNIKAESETDLSAEQKDKLSALRAEIAIGVEQADRNEFVEFTAEDIIAQGRIRLATAGV